MKSQSQGHPRKEDITTSTTKGWPGLVVTADRKITFWKSWDNWGDKRNRIYMIILVGSRERKGKSNLGMKERGFSRTRGS